MPKLDNETIMLAFVAVTALAVLLQAIVLLAILISMRKAARALKEEAAELRSSLMPVIHDTRDMLSRLAPKIESTVDDLSEIAHGLRVQTVQVQSSALDIMEKLHRQTNRMDAMCTGVLDVVDRAGGFVVEVASKPIKQISGVMASIKAIIESLRTPVQSTRQSHSARDKDMFV